MPTEPDLARTRERFLSEEPVSSGVRDTILASWTRSRQNNVAADKIEMPYVRDPDVGTPLIRSATPVLQDLAEQLDGQPVSIVLTDSAGLVLLRLTGDKEFERRLDRVRLAPGFSYAERFVGTNGIGTAIESGRPMHVFGHEHYAENLEMLACAAAPIAHPLSGKTVGAMNLTCFQRDAGSLLVTLARSTAEQVRQALLADARAGETQLVTEYLRVCRRSAGMVLAVGADLTMMNDLARAALDPADQAALLGHGAAALTGERPVRTVVELPTGASARLTVRPVGPGAGVLQVKLLDPPPSVAVAPRVRVPGLAGSSPLWLRACDEVEAAHRSGEWLAVSGEPGVGKVALLRAVALARNPTGRLTVLDAGSESLEDALAAGGTVVLRHADTLTGPALRAAVAALRAAARRPDRPWVAVTTGPGPRGALLRLFPGTVEVPPLRHRLEDLRELVPAMLARLGHGERLTCSPEATQLLLRSGWPGNVEQLLQVLRRAAATRRAGAIRPDDLPPESRTVSRRVLSPLESMERDAIVQGLLDAGGNKGDAARALGMSRATIYRKIHDYGIV